MSCIAARSNPGRGGRTAATSSTDESAAPPSEPSRIASALRPATARPTDSAAPPIRWQISIELSFRKSSARWSIAYGTTLTDAITNAGAISWNRPAVSSPRSGSASGASRNVAVPSSAPKTRLIVIAARMCRSPASLRCTSGVPKASPVRTVARAVTIRAIAARPNSAGEISLASTIVDASRITSLATFAIAIQRTPASAASRSSPRLS